MPEFKVEGDALRREARFRMLSWGTVLLLILVAIFIFVLRSMELTAGSGVGWLAVLAFLGGFYGACILAVREGLSYARRQMVFDLNDDGVIRKRQGYPDVRIPFSEIESVSEELGWLIIRSTEPRRKIAVPNKVSGYDAIRAELVRHHPLSARAKFPWKRIALLTASALSWISVLWFHDTRVITLAGAAAFTTLAFGSSRLWDLSHSSPRRMLLWTSIVFTWLLAFLVIYLRITRP